MIRAPGLPVVRFAGAKMNAKRHQTFGYPVVEVRSELTKDSRVHLFYETLLIIVVDHDLAHRSLITFSGVGRCVIRYFSRAAVSKLPWRLP